MADSHVSGIVKLIQQMNLNPALAGVCPPPLPITNSMPYVTVQKVVGVEQQSHDGPSGLQRSIIQINCWDRDYEQADSIREQIKDNLLNYQGPAGSKLIGAPIEHYMDTEMFNQVVSLHQHITRLVVWWERV